MRSLPLAEALARTGKPYIVKFMQSKPRFELDIARHAEDGSETVL